MATSGMGHRDEMTRSRVAYPGKPSHRRRSRMAAAAALALALALPACASLIPERQPDTFDLTAARNFPKSSGGRGLQLVVGEPVAVQALNSSRILVRSAGGQVAYVPAAQWADELPKLLQARIIQSLENASRLRSVGRSGDRIEADYELVTDLRAFEVSAGSPNEAVVEIAAKLVHSSSGRIAAAKVFSARAPVAGVNGAAAAAGLDRALGAALVDLVGWVTGRV